MGPAGSGKSTYCATMMTHCQTSGRSVHLVNLDPAAERFEYKPTIGMHFLRAKRCASLLTSCSSFFAIQLDICELITLEDVMDELQYGPNGGLIYCMEFLLNNIDWLEEKLGDFENDYLIFDCPGQIELYTHFTIMRRICESLQRWNFTICGVYLLESQFIEDKGKYFSGVLSAMSAMINLEIPHVNVMTKMDLIEGAAGAAGVGSVENAKASKKGNNRRKGPVGGGMRKRDLERYLDPDPLLLVEDVNAKTSPRFHSLNQAIVQLIEDYNMVSFLPLNIQDEESVNYVLSSVDNAMQYGEDLEPKVFTVKQEPKDQEFDVDFDG
ncbi:GPN-loop GTPase [Endogone sp. FLAS-F59071]|nr:GPN-loop GTPase [Endogone sp. FLAS-F59071]|eukprot:RUS17614.1 GPN-loop GTPase [Endogone sp. FLAS-F59071]